MRRITIDSFPGGVDERCVRRGDQCDGEVMQYIMGTSDGIDDTQDILQNPTPISSHYIGDVRLFHTFYRPAENEPYQYAGLCPLGEQGNMHPEKSRRVFIISRCHADDEDGRTFNRRFASALARNIVVRFGDIPVAPHLYFPEFLNDAGFERDFGMEAGHLLMRLCDDVIVATVDGQISDGMREDIDFATVQLAMKPRIMSFTKPEAEEYIKETENEMYEERDGAKHR